MLLFIFFLLVLLYLSCKHIHSFMQFSLLEPIRKYQPRIPDCFFHSAFEIKTSSVFFLRLTRNGIPVFWQRGGEASAHVSSSPPVMIKAFCCVDRRWGVKSIKQSCICLLLLHWPSEINDLLTQIQRANMRVIYSREGALIRTEFRLCLQSSDYYSWGTVRGLVTVRRFKYEPWWLQSRDECVLVYTYMPGLLL